MRRVLVVFALFFGSVPAYAGWIFAGYCYATSADALNAFVKQYPIIGEVQYTSFVSATVNASGVLNYNLSTRPITSNTLSSRTGSMQLQSCATPDDFSLTTALAGFAFFFSTTLFFYAVARGAGSILEKIRRPLGFG